MLKSCEDLDKLRLTLVLISQVDDDFVQILMGKGIKDISLSLRTVGYMTDMMAKILD